MPSRQELDAFVEVSENAPIEKNIDILFEGLRIGELDIAELFRQCEEKIGDRASNWKLIRRWQRAFNLARYFDYALGIPGSKIECGVFKGFSALILNNVARMRDVTFNGNGFHLVDSFAGLSPPTEGDAIEYREFPNGQREFAVTHSAGALKASLEEVKTNMEEFPSLTFHEGWIPEVFNKLPEAAWSFVHIDVDLYEPTLACLEYFTPRLAKGGVMINDDYSSPLFPGGGRAWKEYFKANNLPYVALDTGQAVFIQQD